MKSYEEKLLKASISSGALRFGKFKLKSGRDSSYFWNAARMSDGESAYLQGSAYADKLVEIGVNNFDTIFGPADKGIPIATLATAALNVNHKINKKYIFDRKVPKEYGDPIDRFINGRLERGDRIIIIDDVITTGLTKKKEASLIDSLNLNLKVVGILVGLNRKETDEEGNDPIRSLQEEMGIPVHYVLDSQTIFEFLHNKEFLGMILIDDEKYRAFQDYQARYGVKD
ncbi:orotate phosphoribosyltransferase [Candidatus Micrarchaeota archaeon RBG_16_36_9]|nr:MAG: orotate phosphoribosyltransferase [Candidatus Micrarchaeota archaeon RBG_16_36_9]